MTDAYRRRVAPLNPDNSRDCICPNTTHRHGTWRAYCDDECRCKPCRSAWARYCKRAKHRRHQGGGRILVPAVGVTRRLQALATLGWSCRDIARELGYASNFHVEQLRAGHVGTVHPVTLAAVAALYDRVWDQPPPGRYAAKVRNIAAREGWPPPLAWDDDTIDDPSAEPATARSRTWGDVVDEIAVEEACAGRRVRLSPKERAEAVRRLADRGLSNAVIADRVGLDARSVIRVRLGEELKPTESHVDEATVLAMRAAHAAGKTAAEIGREYGVKPVHAWRIVTGRRWRGAA